MVLRFGIIWNIGISEFEYGEFEYGGISGGNFE
jgi:hypothetical protein